MTSYHHGNLRASLIDTGVELARAHGPDGVVLREVARRAGVSHNAAYRHFADREALLAEIARLGMKELRAAMQRELDAAEAEDHPDDRARAEARLRATGRAYVDFAIAQPGLFDVAFSAIPDEDGLDADTDPYDLLTQVLDEGVAAGAVSPSCGRARRSCAGRPCTGSRPSTCTAPAPRPRSRSATPRST